MPRTYQQQKEAIYKWRESHKDKYNELSRLTMAKAYADKKEYAINKYSPKLPYDYEHQCRKFRNIKL